MTASLVALEEAWGEYITTLRPGVRPRSEKEIETRLLAILRSHGHSAENQVRFGLHAHPYDLVVHGRSPCYCEIKDRLASNELLGDIEGDIWEDIVWLSRVPDSEKAMLVLDSRPREDCDADRVEGGLQTRLQRFASQYHVNLLYAWVPAATRLIASAVRERIPVTDSEVITIIRRLELQDPAGCIERRHILRAKFPQYRRVAAYKPGQGPEQYKLYNRELKGRLPTLVDRGLLESIHAGYNRRCYHTTAKGRQFAKVE